jgi:hypothetical protein
MKVKELIEFLKTQDPELLVFTTGYEGGFENAKADGKIFEVALNYNKDWYYGPHQSIDLIHKDELKKHETAKGILI